MSGKWMVLIVAFCSLAGVRCTNRNKVPGDILSTDKMEAVMWDMAQADQYAVLYLAKDSTGINRKAETMRLYAAVFRLHQVTPEEFRRSYHYYLDHPELNQLLFDSVIARGSRARTALYDRPGQYRGPVTPVRTGGQAIPGRIPAVVIPGRTPGATVPGVAVPGRTPGAGIPGRPGGSVIPGRPGATAPAPAGPEMMRRMHEESVRRRQDSILRVLQLRRDTTKARN